VDVAIAAGFAIRAALDRPGAIRSLVFPTLSGGRDHGRDQFRLAQRLTFS
jgi:hypothetical protein